MELVVLGFRCDSADVPVELSVSKVAREVAKRTAVIRRQKRRGEGALQDLRWPVREAVRAWRECPLMR
jgi:hypothetical protein